MTAAEPRWWVSALCAEVDPRLWDDDQQGSSAWTVLAKRMCQVCPSTGPCLAEALSVEAAEGHVRLFGVRGGLGPEQRRRLIQQTRGDAA